MKEKKKHGRRVTAFLLSVVTALTTIFSSGMPVLAADGTIQFNSGENIYYGDYVTAKMTFDGDIADVIGGFMAIIMMPFTYSIANGIMFGIITWVLLKVLTGKARDIHPVMWISFGLFMLRIITLVIQSV